MSSPAIGTEDLRMTKNGTCPQWSGMATAEEVGFMLSGYCYPAPRAPIILSNLLSQGTNPGARSPPESCFP